MSPGRMRGASSLPPTNGTMGATLATFDAAGAARPGLDGSVRVINFSRAA
jgi:hypothetical protein